MKYKYDLSHDPSRDSSMLVWAPQEQGSPWYVAFWDHDNEDEDATFNGQSIALPNFKSVLAYLNMTGYRYTREGHGVDWYRSGNIERFNKLVSEHFD